MKNEKMINTKMLVKRAEGIDAADLNGEKVMMNLDKGQYYALNQVGGRIWEIIERPSTVREIIDILLKEYEIDAEPCEQAVISFIGRMTDEALIIVM